MSSADPGDHQPEGAGGRAPSADEITDPTLQAEVDNPADANVPSGGESAPGDGTTAADDPPLPAPGAPGELSSDSTPPQGEERGEAVPAEPLGQAPGGDVAPPAPDGAVAVDPPAGGAAQLAPAPGAAATDDDAVTPAQPPPTASAVAASGAAVERAVASKAAEGAAVAEGGGQPPAEEAGEVDGARQALVEGLRGALGDAVLGAHVIPGVDAWVRVDRQAWRQAAEACRDRLGLTYFCYLSAIDWLPSPYGRSEDAGDDSAPAPAERPAPAELEHGYAGGHSRFQLLARYVSPTSHVGLTLKADLDDDEPTAPSVAEVFAGANWHEREVWEMYGVDFAGHPHLTHLYLPGAFEGHPQRKDFPLLSREVKPWPGLVDVEAMPGEADGGEAEVPAS